MINTINDQLYTLIAQKKIFQLFFFWAEAPHLLLQLSRLHLCLQNTCEYDQYDQLYTLIAQKK